MTVQTTKKTFSLPRHIASRLDEVADHTGFSQSNLVLQAVAAYLHRFEQDGSLERWMEWIGRINGGSGVGE